MGAFNLFHSRATSLKPAVNKKGIPLECPGCGIAALEYGGKGFDKHIERCVSYHKEKAELDKKFDANQIEFKAMVKAQEERELQEKQQAKIKEENRDEAAAQAELKKVQEKKESADNTGFVCQACGQKLLKSPMSTAGICTACGGTCELEPSVEQVAEYCSKRIAAMMEEPPKPAPEIKPEFYYGLETPYSLRVTQHGGRHYKGFKIQPAYFCQVNRVPFMESEIICHAVRHREKQGVLDLKKVIHYAQAILDIEYNVQSDIKFTDEISK